MKNKVSASLDENFDSVQFFQRKLALVVVRLCELNVNTTVTARLLGHGDLRSVHRHERGKEIMREAVGLLENPAKILPLARKGKTKKAVTY
jgi:hypothetical protein